MKSGFSILPVFVLLILVSVDAGAQGPPTPGSGPCCWPPITSARAAINLWHFDEPAGNTSSDVAGAANNIGTDHGAMPRPFGVRYRSLEFQGAQWSQVPSGNEVNFLGDCSTNNAESGTIAFWINTTSAGFVTVLDKREPAANFLRGYSVFLSNGRLGFQMATGPGNQSCNSAGSACSNFIATSLPSLADGKWHFVAISFSRCGTPAGLFYVDGATAAFTPRAGLLVNAPPLFIGRRSPALGPNFFTGTIDELMYFKAAYTKSELDALRLDPCQQKCWL